MIFLQHHCDQKQATTKSFQCQKCFDQNLSMIASTILVQKPSSEEVKDYTKLTAQLQVHE